MEFIRTQQLDVPLKEALAHLRRVLKAQGFGRTAEIHTVAPAESEGGGDGTHTLVTGFSSDLARRALAVAPEAALLLTATFLVRQSGDGSLVSVLDPEVLSLVPEQQELQSVVSDVRARIQRVLDGIKDPPPAGAPTASADQVEQRLYEVMLEAIDAVSREDLPQGAERIFTLAKAYTAVASLSRTEEIELHLA